MTEINREYTELLKKYMTKEHIIKLILLIFYKSKIGVLFLTFCIVSTISISPSDIEGPALSAYQMLNTFGILVLILLLIIDMVKVAITENIASIGSLIISYTQLILILSISMSFIAIFHQEINSIIIAAIDNPTDTIAVIFASILLYLMIHHLRLSSYYMSESVSCNKQIRSSRAASMRMNTDETASVSIVRRRAVHEAGHIVAASIFTKMPDNFYAWVSNTISGDSDKGGQVGYRYPDDEETTAIRLTEKMLFCILPLKAEEVILEQPCIGSSSDMNTWELTAKTLMDNFPSKYSWFRAPANNIEANINAITLKDMLDIDLKNADVIVKNNKDLINEIADRLIENTKLDHVEIIEFLDRVILE